MIKKQRLVKRWSLLLASVFSLNAANVQAVDNDLSVLPALESKLASHSMFMDIARAGDRLVAVGDRGHILTSDDSGASWQQAKVPVRVMLNSVAFPTVKEGWAVGHEGVVLKTQDAGSSWQKAAPFEPAWINQQMTDGLAQFIERRRLAIAELPEDQREDAEYALEDTEFLLEDLQLYVKSGVGQPWMKVWFDTPQHGVLVGSVGMSFETRDGGNSWQPMNDKLFANGSHLYAIGKGPRGIVVAGERGTAMVAADQGQWQAINTGYERSLFGLVSVADNRCVLAVGFGGLVVRDCGADNAIISNELGSSSLTGGVLLADQRVLVYGMGTQAYISADNGVHFKPVNLGFGANMAAVETASGELVFAGMRGIRKVNLKDLGDS